MKSNGTAILTTWLMTSVVWLGVSAYVYNYPDTFCPNTISEELIP